MALIGCMGIIFSINFYVSQLTALAMVDSSIHRPSSVKNHQIKFGTPSIRPILKMDREPSMHGYCGSRSENQIIVFVWSQYDGGNICAITFSIVLTSNKAYYPKAVY